MTYIPPIGEAMATWSRYLLWRLVDGKIGTEKPESVSLHPLYSEEVGVSGSFHHITQFESWFFRGTFEIDMQGLVRVHGELIEEGEDGEELQKVPYERWLHV